MEVHTRQGAVRVRAGARTDRGLKRASNEDFVFLRPKPGPVRLVAFAALFHFLAWFALMHYLRYLFPSLAMLCFCLAGALRRRRQWSSRFGVVATGATAVWLVGGLGFGVALPTGPARVVAGRVASVE